MATTTPVSPNPRTPLEFSADKKRDIIAAAIACRAVYKENIQGWFEDYKQPFSQYNALCMTSDSSGRFAEFRRGDNDVFIAIRGTKSSEDGWVDAKVYPSFTDVGNLHTGFHQRSQLIPLKMVERYASNGKNVWICGHSMGGAVAAIAAVHIRRSLKIAEAIDRVRCITFGAPLTGLIGNADFVGNMDNDHFLHIVNQADLVPKILPIVYDVVKMILSTGIAASNVAGRADIALPMKEIQDSLPNQTSFTIGGQLAMFSSNPLAGFFEGDEGMANTGLDIARDCIGIATHAMSSYFTSVCSLLQYSGERTMGEMPEFSVAAVELPIVNLVEVRPAADGGNVVVRVFGTNLDQIMKVSFPSVCCCEAVNLNTNMGAMNGMNSIEFSLEKKDGEYERPRSLSCIIQPYWHPAIITNCRLSVHDYLNVIMDAASVIFTAINLFVTLSCHQDQEELAIDLFDAISSIGDSIPIEVLLFYLAGIITPANLKELVKAEILVRIPLSERGDKKMNQVNAVISKLESFPNQTLKVELNDLISRIIVGDYDDNDVIGLACSRLVHSFPANLNFRPSRSSMESVKIIKNNIDLLKRSGVLNEEASTYIDNVKEHLSSGTDICMVCGIPVSSVPGYNLRDLLRNLRYLKNDINEVASRPGATAVPRSGALPFEWILSLNSISKLVEMSIPLVSRESEIPGDSRNNDLAIGLSTSVASGIVGGIIGVSVSTIDSTVANIAVNSVRTASAVGTSTVSVVGTSTVGAMCISGAVGFGVGLLPFVCNYAICPPRITGVSDMKETGGDKSRSRVKQVATYSVLWLASIQRGISAVVESFSSNTTPWRSFYIDNRLIAEDAGKETIDFKTYRQLLKWLLTEIGIDCGNFESLTSLEDQLVAFFVGKGISFRNSAEEIQRGWDDIFALKPLKSKLKPEDRILMCFRIKYVLSISKVRITFMNVFTVAIWGASNCGKSTIHNTVLNWSGIPPNSPLCSLEGVEEHNATIFPTSTIVTYPFGPRRSILILDTVGVNDQDHEMNSIAQKIWNIAHLRVNVANILSWSEYNKYFSSDNESKEPAVMRAVYRDVKVSDHIGPASITLFTMSESFKSVAELNSGWISPEFSRIGRRKCIRESPDYSVRWYYSNKTKSIVDHRMKYIRDLVDLPIYADGSEMFPRIHGKNDFLEFLNYWYQLTFDGSINEPYIMLQLGENQQLFKLGVLGRFSSLNSMSNALSRKLDNKQVIIEGTPALADKENRRIAIVSAEGTTSGMLKWSWKSDSISNDRSDVLEGYALLTLGGVTHSTSLGVFKHIGKSQMQTVVADHLQYDAIEILDEHGDEMKGDVLQNDFAEHHVKVTKSRVTTMGLIRWHW